MKVRFVRLMIVGLVIGAFIAGTVVANQMNKKIQAAETEAKKAKEDLVKYKSEIDNMSMMDHSQISADQLSTGAMMMMLQDKRGEAFDKIFLEAMIMHHYGAIEMANLAKKSAKHPELKKLSDNIIATQDKEMKQMQQWEKEWGYTE